MCVQAPRHGEAERGAGRAPSPEVKVVVVDEPPPAVARLQAQRPLAPLQVTTQAAPTPMTVASGGVDQPPPAANYQPAMRTPPPVRLAPDPIKKWPRLQPAARYACVCLIIKILTRNFVRFISQKWL